MGAPGVSALGTPLFMGADLTLFLSRATRDGLQITEEQREAWAVKHKRRRVLPDCVFPPGCLQLGGDLGKQLYSSTTWRTERRFGPKRGMRVLLSSLILSWLPVVRVIVDSMGFSQVLVVGGPWKRLAFCKLWHPFRPRSLGCEVSPFLRTSWGSFYLPLPKLLSEQDMFNCLPQV